MSSNMKDGKRVPMTRREFVKAWRELTEDNQRLILWLMEQSQSDNESPEKAQIRRLAGMKSSKAMEMLQAFYRAHEGSKP